MNRRTKTSMFLILAVFLAVFLFSYSISEAKSGCCSHHGGVCGCGCCDGTSLSATCAPYYPECNSAPVPKPITVPSAPTPTNPTTPATNTTPSVPSSNTLPAVTNTENQSKDNSGSFVGGLALGALGVGGLAWYIHKKKKKT